MGCRFLLQGIFQTQRLSLHSSAFLALACRFFFVCFDHRATWETHYLFFCFYLFFWFPLAGASSPDMEPSYGGGLFDMVKGGAGRLFSNLKDNLKDTLKDTSSRVIQSVTRYVLSSLYVNGPCAPRGSGYLPTAYLAQRLSILWCSCMGSDWGMPLKSSDWVFEKLQAQARRTWLTGTLEDSGCHLWLSNPSSWILTQYLPLLT